MEKIQTNNPTALIGVALDVLACASQQIDPAVFHAQLQSFAKANPKGVQALLKAMQGAGLEVGGTVAPQLSASQTIVAPQIGEFVKGRGIYMGHDAGMDFYSANDFLRDKAKQLMFVTFNQANAELTSRNGGRSYGNGTEKVLRKAMAEGTYKEGDLFVPFREFMNGRNADGKPVRDENVCSLYKIKPAFKKIKGIVESGSDSDRWALSSTELPYYSSNVYVVSLPDGVDVWHNIDFTRSRVVPFRAFKRLDI